VRRLYSTFAGGWPGIGLLLMRLVAGAVLLVRAAPPAWSAEPFPITLTSAALAGAGLLLIAGLWSPLVGTAIAVLEIWQVLTFAENPLVPLLVATICGALAMLGPGRWSVDSRLFGWRRIEAPPRKKNALGPSDNALPTPPRSETPLS
jgi:hypothetical protein